MIALAALMPLAPDLVPVLVITVLAALVVRHRSWRSSTSVGHKWRGAMYGPVLLYVLYVIGLAWSVNMDYGFFDLQIKLPLALFPLLFLRLPVEVRKGGGVVVASFVAGNVIAVMLCCAMVPLHALSAGGQWSSAVFGSDFSLFLHPSYFAMYLAFSLAALLLAPVGAVARPGVRTGMVLVLCLGIVLCGSKAGWACLPLVLLIVLAFRWRHRSTRRMVLLLIAGSCLGVAVLTAASPNVRQRVEEAWNAVASPEDRADASTSTEERKLAWNGAKEVIRMHLPFGTGTGDVKDELVATYVRKGYSRMAELRLNAHNQYLQTMATLGWPGILALLGMLVVCMHVFIRMRDVLGVIFILLNAANWAVESMLEVQAGVVFFAFLLFALAIRGMPSLQITDSDPP